VSTPTSPEAVRWLKSRFATKTSFTRRRPELPRKSTETVFWEPAARPKRVRVEKTPRVTSVAVPVVPLAVRMRRYHWKRSSTTTAY